MDRRVLLTERFARSAVSSGQVVLHFDREVAGFCLQVRPSGLRSFVLDYRFGGRRRRLTIGRWPEWSVRQARDRAASMRRQLDVGEDPGAARSAVGEVSKVADLVDRYLDLHAVHLARRNALDQGSMLTNLVVPHIGAIPVHKVTALDVDLVLSKVAAGRTRPTPVRANRCGEVLRKMFALSVAWGLRSDNPASGFRRRVEEERARYLTADEVMRLADLLSRSEDRRSAGVVQICMLTGARLGEVRQARFSQFHLDQLVWEKPAAATKQRRVHRVPISEDVAALVRLRREAVPTGTAWLFPGEARAPDGSLKDQPVQDIRKFWASASRSAGIEGVRIHDLRHTFASLLVSGGASLEMIGRLLGHSQSRTTQRYAHLSDDPLRVGVESVASVLRSRPRVIGGS